MREQLSPTNKAFKEIFDILNKDGLSPIDDLALLAGFIIIIFDLAEKQGHSKENITQMRRLIVDMIINGIKDE
jgi:hypothetical protein